MTKSKVESIKKFLSRDSDINQNILAHLINKKQEPIDVAARMLRKKIRLHEKTAKRIVLEYEHCVLGYLARKELQNWLKI